jgi:hypothetical protein
MFFSRQRIIILSVVAVIAVALGTYILLAPRAQQEPADSQKERSAPKTLKPIEVVEQVNQQLNDSQGRPAKNSSVIYRQSKTRAIAISLVCLPGGPQQSVNYVPRISVLIRQRNNWIPAQQSTPLFFRSVDDPNLQRVLASKQQRQRAWALAQSLAPELQKSC